MIWLCLLVLVAFLTACGQLLFKLAAMKEAAFFRKFLDCRFLAGAGLFLICPFLSILALKHVEYSHYYATTALNYVFVVVGSRYILAEPVGTRKIFGMGCIMAGLVFYMF